MAGHVQVTKKFTQWTDRFAKGVYAGLGDVGDNIAQETRGSAPKRGYAIGGILNSVQPGRTKRSRKGAEIEVGYGDFRGIFFERGTYRGQRGKGVMAGNYLKKAAKNAQGDAMNIFKRHLR